MATETWVLNKVLLNLTEQIFNVNFTSNGQSYATLMIYIPDLNQQIIMYGETSVYMSDLDGWTNEAYRTIVLDSPATGNLLTWLMADGVKQTPATPRKSVDLTTLPGWASLSTGSHNITVVARANGYRDSDPSAAVSVEKAEVTYTDCITFTGETSDFTLAVGSEEPKEWDGIVEYSTDHNTWTVWDGSEISSNNKKLYLRGSGNTAFYMLDGAHFVLSARAACSGNIQTLLEYSNPPAAVARNCYYSMFNGCENLTQAPALPATTLEPYCYNYMFHGCTSLTTAPELPATTLTEGCYSFMFDGCKNLTRAPELPATTLTEGCYQSMFSGCTSLTTAPALPATTLAPYCYSFMFDGCKNLTRAPELPATTLTEDCYQSMFSGCTSLTTAPALPATSLADGCYGAMFRGCTSLTQAPALPATTLALTCYRNMFRDCTNLKISATQSPKYPTAWRIPSSGTISSTSTDWNGYMLNGTGGTFTSDPSINTTYYGAW